MFIPLSHCCNFSHTHSFFFFFFFFLPYHFFLHRLENRTKPISTPYDGRRWWDSNLRTPACKSPALPLCYGRRPIPLPLNMHCAMYSCLAVQIRSSLSQRRVSKSSVSANDCITVSYSVYDYPGPWGPGWVGRG